MTDTFAPPRSQRPVPTVSRRNQAKRALQASLAHRIDLVGAVGDRLDQIDLLASSIAEQLTAAGDPMTRAEILTVASSRAGELLAAVRSAASEAIAGGVVADDLDELVGVPPGSLTPRRTRSAKNASQS